MGILLGALGGFGEAMQNVGAKNQAAQLALENATAENQQKSDLDLQRQQAMMQFQETLKNAPLNRFATALQNTPNQTVPVAAAPVGQITQTNGIVDPGTMNGVDGQPIQTKGGSDVGLSGNLADLQNRILSAKSLTDDPVNGISDEDRAGALAQLKAQAMQQYAQQSQANKAAAAGQSLPETNDEKYQRVLSNIKMTDPVAYAAAAPLAADPFMTVADGAALFDKRTQKVAFQNDGRTARLEQIEAGKTDRQEAAIAAATERQEKALKAQADIAASKDKDTQFIKELKTLYPDGGPDYDEALRQRINKETGINAAAGGGGRSVVYNNRIIASGNEISAALRNITELPVGSNSGFLGSGQPEGKGIMSATAAALKNELNSDQVKTYNTLWTGISRNLGTLETSGLATTGSLIASIDKLSIVPGDNGYNVQRKLAEVRQIVDAALEPKLSDPTVPPTQKQYIQGVMDKVAQAVPYTHADLTAYQQAITKNRSLTLADYAKQTVSAPKTGTQQSTAPTIPADISGLLDKYGTNNSGTPFGVTGAQDWSQ